MSKNILSNRTAILGITNLEWHSAEETPAMHIERYEADSWLQSEQLLLADAAGKMAMGYCEQSLGEKTQFEVMSGLQLGEIRLWTLLPKPPVEKLEEGREPLAKQA
jgi:hypothetical protein